MWRGPVASDVKLSAKPMSPDLRAPYNTFQFLKAMAAEGRPGAEVPLCYRQLHRDNMLQALQQLQSGARGKRDAPAARPGRTGCGGGVHGSVPQVGAESMGVNGHDRGRGPACDETNALEPQLQRVPVDVKTMMASVMVGSPTAPGAGCGP